MIVPGAEQTVQEADLTVKGADGKVSFKAVHETDLDETALPKFLVGALF